ncbi:MAG: hypothetical protein GF353_23870 [Candidatus Lokiarchaeota archaeon]|nr:hypothetical protein [Candidatus Lokiarchaeota archaeon]
MTEAKENIIDFEVKHEEKLEQPVKVERKETPKKTEDKKFLDYYTRFSPISIFSAI